MGLSGVYEDLLDRVKGLSFEDSLRYIVSLLYPDISRVFEIHKVFLCVQPHPDDCDLGAGGTIASLTSRGSEVYYLTVTDGRLGTLDRNMYPELLASIRRREQEDAAKLLGVKDVYWLDFRDAELSDTLSVRSRIITYIRKLKPSVVLAPDPYAPYEAHSDHIITGRAALEAVLLSGLPHVNDVDIRSGLEAFTPRFVALYYTSNPNVFQDISGTVKVKVEALLKHESQFKDRALIEFIVGVYATLYGKLAGLDYAEGFKVIPAELLHVTPFLDRV